MVDLERLGLPARAVEREHELAAKPLAKRMLVGEGLELPTSSLCRACLELRLDAVLERREPELLEPPDLLLGKGLEAQVRERRAAPERERAPELRRALGAARARASSTRRLKRSRSSCSGSIRS